MRQTVGSVCVTQYWIFPAWLTLTNHSHTLPRLVFLPFLFFFFLPLKTCLSNPTVGETNNSLWSLIRAKRLWRGQDRKRWSVKKETKSSKPHQIQIPSCPVPCPLFQKNIPPPPIPLSRGSFYCQLVLLPHPPPSLPFRFLLSVSVSPSMSRQAETGRLLLCLQSDTISS